MNPIPKLLSKTKLLRGYRCNKCIYLTIHKPQLEAPISAETQALFDQGNLVGAKAREYYPGGILIDNKPWDFGGALSKTRELIAKGSSIIYEAAFAYQGFYARADIIQYSPSTERWRIFEVKSSTKVKAEHYDDVGLQVWIMAKSGLPIEQINLVHLNPECRYPELRTLFKEVDITEEIRVNYPSVKPKLSQIITGIQEPEVPDIDLGAYCLLPNQCGFTQHCWQEKKIPTLSVFNLPKIQNRKWELYQEGVIQLDDPRLSNLNELQERVVHCYKTGERYLNPDLIQAGMAEWQFPLIFLDFETINPAIPRYDGCKPFEQLPFQFSVHTLASLEVEPTHQEFLFEYSEDPRPSLIPALLKACGEEGTIIAYFSQFESERIEALATYSPKDQANLLKLNTRMADPLPLIREAVYDNAFKGSFSLKAVAPALLGEAYSYEGMDIADGGAAQRGFEELISDKTSAERKKRIKKAMLEYCKKDTLVMVALVKWLYAAHKKSHTP